MDKEFREMDDSTILNLTSMKIDDSLLKKWEYSSNFTSPLVIRLRLILNMAYLTWSSRDVVWRNIMCYWFCSEK